MDRVQMRNVLREASGWTLTERRWSRVADKLVAIADALGRGADEELAQAVVDLELMAPVRIRTRLGDEPRVPPPPAVRERLNRIVSDLEGAPTDAARGGGDHGDDDRGV
jgi:hypothetical protein